MLVIFSTYILLSEYDYRLEVGSSCIDKANPTLFPNNDIENNLGHLMETIFLVQLQILVLMNIFLNDLKKGDEHASLKVNYNINLAIYNIL